MNTFIVENNNLFSFCEKKYFELKEMEYIFHDSKMFAIDIRIFTVFSE